MSGAVKLAVLALALAAIWGAWRWVDVLRGTWLHDVRLILLVAVAFGVLSLADAISGPLAVRLTRSPPRSPREG